LWFDSHHQGKLSILSSALDVKDSLFPQIITTEETAKLIELFHKKPNALICQYNRPFSIGQLRLELLPSGHILGGASLSVNTIEGPLLYAPYLQPAKIPTVRAMQLTKAKFLVLGAHQPLPATPAPSRRREKEKLLDDIHAAISAKRWPVLLCPSLGLAQELTHALATQQLPVAVHSTIYKSNKVYEASGVKLGTYSLYSARRSKHKIILLPSDFSEKTKLPPLGERPYWLIRQCPALEGSSPVPAGISGEYLLALSSSAPELAQVIQHVAPKEVYFYGHYAKQYAEYFANLGLPIKTLFPNDQPPLF
jgi:Cft2 family RNA processing exonuclease